MMSESQFKVLASLTTITIILGFSLLWPGQKNTSPVVLKPIKTLYPTYPDHLKKEGIAGEVIVWAWIDEKGEVKIQSPIPIRSLHPELDKLAIEAANQWKYAPPLTLGKPRGAWTYISIIFDPGELPEVEDFAPREPLSGELLALLDRGWEYCRKIDDIAHFYLCRERISETLKSIVNVGPSMMGSGSVKGLDLIVRVNSFVPDLASPKANRYVNDYQITTQNNRVAELRTPVKPLSNERNSLFGKKPLSFPIPISVPTRLLAPGFRDEYLYSFGEDDKVLDKNCRVIELKARKKRGIEIQKAILWLERDSGRVVQAEIECETSAVDERILAECRQYYLVPHLTAAYEYGDGKKGILFPSRSKIVLDYSQLGRTNTRDTKMKLDIRYDNYRFFTVETEPRIIRSAFTDPRSAWR
jgi:TonB family protein